MTQSESKATLRQSMRAVLANLDERWARAASARLCENLGQHLRELPAVEHVLAWARFFAGEVDLSAFIATQLKAGRRVYLPRSAPEHTLQFVAIDQSWRDTAVVGWGGVPEPGPDCRVLFDPHDAAQSIVITPGLAFDERGGRIGRGLGFYDKFLARSLMRPAHLVGVGWELQIVPEVPMLAHDQELEALVTERRILQFAGDAI